MRKRNKLIVVGVLAAALAIAVAVPAFAAIGSTPPAAATSADSVCPGPAGGLMAGDVSGAVSQLLGMQPADIAAQRQAGESLAQIAQSKGVSADTLIATMLDAQKTALAQAVKDGSISQTQADFMANRMGSVLSARVNQTGTGPGNVCGPGGNIGGCWQ